MLSFLKKKLFSSQLRINMISGVGYTGINAVSMMLAYPIYLHYLGYEKYGVWLVMAIILNFAQLGNLGIDQAVMKLVAEEHSRKNNGAIEKYITTALVILMMTGSVALTMILLCKTQIIGVFKLSDENTAAALRLLPYIGMLSIYVFIVSVLNAVLSGLGRMDLSNYAQAVGRIIAVGIASFMLAMGKGIESILVGNTLSFVFTHLMSLYYIKRMTNLKFLKRSRLCLASAKKILTFGGHLFGGALVTMLLAPFNKLMISRYIGVASVPIFEIAFNGGMQLRGLLEAGLRATMPEISRVSSDMTSEGLNRIKQISRHGMTLILVLGSAFYGLILFLSPWLLRLWLRDNYNDAITLPFRVMLIGTYLSLLGVPAFYVLMGMGRVKHILRTYILQSLTNVILVVVFVYVLHHQSLVMVSSACMAAMSAATVYLLWQEKRAISESRHQ